MPGRLKDGKVHEYSGMDKRKGIKASHFRVGGQ